MSAYWIAEYVDITDDTKMAAYRDLATSAIESAGGTFLARDLPAKVYEAGKETRVVVIRFDDVEQAVAAHDSPAYQEALAALDGGAVRDLRIVDGV